MQVQIQTLSKSDNTSFMIRILANGYFPFTYNGNEIKMDKKEFPKPR